MSYCRWSSDDYMCDLYCYQAESGYVTHVARSRLRERPPSLPGPPLPDQGEDAFREYLDALRRQSEFVRNAPREEIGGPHDGETFVDPDLPSFHARLKYLRERGYRFPDRVFDVVREEMEETVEQHVGADSQ